MKVLPLRILGGIFSLLCAVVLITGQVLPAYAGNLVGFPCEGDPAICGPDEVCDPELGVCVLINGECVIDEDCFDGITCNGDETCEGGVCFPGPPLDCNDVNVCTEDFCIEPIGCINDPVANGISCADSDVCNGDETCEGGVCNSAAPLDCNDVNVCTEDICNPISGCSNPPIPMCGIDGTDSQIGGTVMSPLDTTALLLGGAQMNAAWMIPVVVAGIGIAVFVIKRRK